MEKRLKIINILLALAVVVLGVAVVNLYLGRTSEGEPRPSGGNAAVSALPTDTTTEQPNEDQEQSAQPSESGGETAGEEQEIRGLQCSVAKGSLSVVVGKQFQVTDQNGADFEAAVEDGVYTVTGSATAENHLTVTIPADITFEQVNLTATGGAVSARDIRTDSLATRCDAGAIDFAGEVLGDASVDHSLGKTVLELTGSESDYNYELEYSMGHVGIGAQQFAGAGGSQSIDNGAERTMQIRCAMGSVSVLFV